MAHNVKLYDRIFDTKAIIFYLCEKNNNLSASHIAVALGISRNTVHRYLNRLTIEGFINRDSQGRISATPETMLSFEMVGFRGIYHTRGQQLFETLYAKVYTQAKFLGLLS